MHYGTLCSAIRYQEKVCLFIDINFMNGNFYVNFMVKSLVEMFKNYIFQFVFLYHSILKNWLASHENVYGFLNNFYQILSI